MRSASRGDREQVDEPDLGRQPAAEVTLELAVSIGRRGEPRYERVCGFNRLNQVPSVPPEPLTTFRRISAAYPSPALVLAAGLTLAIVVRALARLAGR
ncbi:MAG: hypothetical protein ACRDG7_12575 [Candidatus Limnocylindria bacterium]